MEVIFIISIYITKCLVIFYVKTRINVYNNNFYQVFTIKHFNFYNQIHFLQYGFTLDRTVNDAINPYLEVHSDTCILKGVEKSSALLSPHHPAIVFLKMDFENLRLL